MAFNPAAAAEHWDRTRPGPDLDPAPRRLLTNSEGRFAVLTDRTPCRDSRRSLLPPGWATMTPDARRRWLRNLMLLFGARACGLSERELAGMFDLPRSRIHAILAEQRGRTAAPDEDDDDEDD